MDNDDHKLKRSFYKDCNALTELALKAFVLNDCDKKKNKFNLAFWANILRIIILKQNLRNIENSTNNCNY